MPIFVPVRDFDLTRGEEQLLMEYYGVAVEEVITGGDDKTMWCRSIASGGIDLSTELPDSIWMWLTPPTKAPDKPTTLILSWQNGLPVALNGKQLPLDQIIEQLNTIGGANGIYKIARGLYAASVELRQQELHISPLTSFS